MNRPRAPFRAAPIVAAAVLMISVLAAVTPGAAGAWPSNSRAPLARGIASSAVRNSEMYAVTVAPRSTDAWALADNQLVGKTTSPDVVLRRHDGHWRRLAIKGTPDVPTLTLNGVAAGSSKQIWVVGYHPTTSNPATAQDAPVLARSSGGTFNAVKIKGVRTGDLFTVAASSPTNAWAIGVSGDYVADLSLHWNGKAWSKVRLRTTVAGVIDSETVVSTSGPKNAWLISQGRGGQVIDHWNGKKWTVMPLPAGNPQLSSIATSAASTWVVGTIGTSAYAARWTGKTWTTIKLAHAATDMFESVTADGSTAYAVGRNNANVVANSSDVLVAARLHGNSGAIRKMKAIAKFTVPNAVAASSKVVMAVGYYESEGACKSPFHSFAQTLVGAIWKPVKIPARLVPASATGFGLCA